MYIIYIIYILHVLIYGQNRDKTRDKIGTRTNYLTMLINFNNIAFMKERISNIPVVNEILPLQADTPPDLSQLDDMTAEELRALVERMARQCGLVAMMTKEETAQAMRDVLAETALRPLIPGINLKADIQNRMNAIDKWLDRAEGRAKQQIEHTGKDGEALSIRLLAVQERLLKDVTTPYIDNTNS